MAEHEHYANEQDTYFSAPSEPIDSVWIRIKTSGKRHAGTDAKVRIRIGDFASQILDVSGDEFEKNSDDVFGFPVETDLATFRNAHKVLSHDNTGSGPGWYVKSLMMQVNLKNIGMATYKIWEDIGWLATDEKPYTTEVLLL